MMAAAGLLLSMFGIPGVLLWLGHHLRRQPLRAKYAFWGGVVGWSAAVSLMLVLAMVPPVLWDHGARQAAVYWLPFVGGLLGLGAGALRRAP